MRCRSCDSECVLFLDMGDHPLPNRFLTPEMLVQPEPRYPLKLVQCYSCSLVQLEDAVPPDQLFSEYDYASSTSASFRQHFAGLADWLWAEYELPQKAKVVDIGSNDGILLRPLAARGFEAIGIEPAKNLAKLAWDQGLSTVNEFFGPMAVERIGTGSVDAVTACNVFAHVPQVHEFVANVNRLLKDDGVFVIEVQYWGDTVGDLTFDNIYLEHVFYWTGLSLRRLFERHGMRIDKVLHVPTHGGSLRVAVKKGADRRPNAPLPVIGHEGPLNYASTPVAFAERVQGVRGELAELAVSLRAQGKKVIGYGAPAKSTTLLNYVPELAKTLAYIVDDAPLKQGKYTPGTHIPVYNPVRLSDGLERAPDVVAVLAWNFAEPIMKKVREMGLDCDFLLPVPPRLFRPEKTMVNNR